MYYDGNRSKWLSISTLSDGAGVNNNTSPGNFYKRFNGLTLSDSQGPFIQKGTVVGIGYTSSTTATHTFQVRINGTIISLLASCGAASASNFTKNDDFEAGIFSCFNQGPDTVNGFQAVVYYKLRT
jgi:hypothetical protein